MNDFSTVITIGNFDGVHIGHRHLISMTAELARRLAGRAVAITFVPHPHQFFSPSPHFFLYPENVKERLLTEFGLDEVIYLPFNEICNLSPEDFFQSVLMPLEPAAIVLGENFHFGAGKTGDINLLRELCAEKDVALHSLLMAPYKDEIVSSSRIRLALQAGNLVDANAMLGEPYALYGRVEHGAGRGHTLGFATANIQAPDQVIPKIGAYATRVQIDHSPDLLPAMTAVTQTPTFGAVQTVVETHILDFNEDIYGKSICIQFEERLRDEVIFISREALIRQLHEDCERVRKIKT